MRRGTWIAAAGALAAALASSEQALAAPAAGVTQGGALVTFDTARPGSFTSIKPIAGLQPGEYVGGIDYRYTPSAGTPADASALYAIGVVHGATDTLRTYRIDTGSGQATLVGAPIAGVARTTLAPAAYGVDFNHTVDRIRVVNNADENLRVNPNNGALAGNDTDLTPGFGVAAVAYDRVDGDAATPTTLFGLAQDTAQLIRIGDVDGRPPGSPNGGVVTPIGALGIASDDADTLNLDIAPDGAAYATATPAGGQASLYTANLATGALTPVGTLALPLESLAVLPRSTTEFSTTAVTAAEGTAATFVVTRSGLPNDTASVRWATADGSATSADYVPASGTLTFAPGETSRTFAVATKQDGDDEPDETVALSLSDPSAPGVLGPPVTATLTIADDDPAPPVARAPDRAAPRTSLSAPRSVTLAAFLKRGVRVSARPDESASLAFSLVAAPRSARLAAAYRLTLASRSFGASATSRTATLKPARKLVGTPRKPFKVQVRVVATDAANNVAPAMLRYVTVRPGKPPRRVRR